jgi:hypothetical protein
MIDKLPPGLGPTHLQRTEPVRRGERTAKAGKEEARTAGASTAAPLVPLEGLRRELAGMLESIDPDDAEAFARARPQLIRAMLLAELGGMVRDHPELPSLVATLDRDLSGPDMAQRWRALADFLRRTP